MQHLLNVKFGKNEYKLVSDNYVNSRSICDFKHKCDNIFKAKWGTMIVGDYKCPCTHKNNSSRTAKSHTLEIQKWRNTDNWICTNYINTKKLNTYFHKKCGKSFQTSMDSFRLSSGCPHCEGFYGSRLKTREVDGITFHMQGHEPITLDRLLKKYKAEDIKTGCDKVNRLMIPYTYMGEIKKYVPDFFIESANLIVETKSLGTMGLRKFIPKPNRVFKKTQKKAKQCLENGYKFELHLYSDDGKTRIKLPKNWLDMTRKEVLASLSAIPAINAKYL